MFGEEHFTAKIKYTTPFEFDLKYCIIQLYNECVKWTDIKIKDPNLTKQFAHILRSIVKLVEDGYSHKWHVQLLLGEDMIIMLKGV